MAIGILVRNWLLVDELEKNIYAIRPKPDSTRNRSRLLEHRRRNTERCLRLLCMKTVKSVSCVLRQARGPKVCGYNCASNRTAEHRNFQHTKH